MKPNPKGEYENFTVALKKVLQVSHEEMQARLAAAKREKKRPSRPTSDRGSRPSN
jgi:hypothetical protein